MKESVKFCIATIIISIVFNTYSLGANEISQEISEISSMESLDNNEYGEKALEIYQQNFEQAVEYVNKNIRLHPNDVRPYLIRGIVYGYWGDKLKNKEYAGQAWNDYTFCIKKEKSKEFIISKSELADIYVRRGTMSMLADSYEQGLADYEMSCKLQNQECKGLDFLRLIYLTDWK